MQEQASKLIGKSGGLTIPKHLRHQLGFSGGMAIDLTTTKDGELLLSKHRPSCTICGGTNDVVSYKGFDICRECFLGVGEELDLLDNE